MADKDQIKRIEKDRKSIINMLSGRSRADLTDFSTIDSDVDSRLFKDSYIEQEAIVYDGDISIGSNNKKVSSDLVENINYARLLSLASQPEISDVLDIIIDELFSYKHGTQIFAEFSEISIDSLSVDENLKKKLKKDISESFSKIYSLHKFDEQTISNEYDIFKIVKLFFVLGKCRFFIEYDNLVKPTSVKAIHYLDPRLYSLEKFHKKSKGRETIFYRITKNEKTNRKSNFYSGSAYSTSNMPAIALDAQIVNVDWHDLDVTTNDSYVDSLERSFNIYRLMERTRIAWSVMNSTFRSVNVIPTKGQGRVKSLQTLRAAIQKYSEKVTFEDTSGQVEVNGEVNNKFNKELWVAETSSGRPDFSTLGNDGPDLQDMAPVSYFQQRFNKATKVPPSLLDREQQNYWSNDESSISLEYNRFNKWLDRIRRALSPMLTKPTWNNFVLSEVGAEHKSDLEIKRAVTVIWHTRDVFAKQLELAMLEKNIGVIDGLSNISNGVEDSKIPLLSKTLLVKKYLGMTDDDLKAHAEQIKKDIEASLELEKELGINEEEEF